ncbi:Hydantoinase/oxoprolinase-domain-containing protein [Amylocarpus encephaloides]|uniref:Hydantoinase/oxoprolinase-domain-containing protein n=1 Tax=Amylocarpus encephaloides TaxID=45428 RepID=A0A9P8C8B5_9HELO|nr:Hydantoinase/oxoprolinase-domain-containing protein [Amylocarpus encephaloides]
MQSDGGLVDFCGNGGLKSVLSGAADAVVGYSQTDWDTERKKAVIGFDTVGTSTGCCRFCASFFPVGYFNFVLTFLIIQITTNLCSVAGRGSMLFWCNDPFAVGPVSTGDHPGQVCYPDGGTLTVMDANLLLGRIVASYFPKILSPNEDQTLGAEINKENREVGRADSSAEQVAPGFSIYSIYSHSSIRKKLRVYRCFRASWNRVRTYGY